MRNRDLLLKMEATEGRTLVQGVIETLEKAIRSGRLQPGQALPGSRVLAESLQVSRNTVLSALCALEEEGWLVTEPNRGTFVASVVPAARRVQNMDLSSGAAAHPGFDLPSRLTPLSDLGSNTLILADGLPDPRVAPTQAMAAAYQRALRRHGQDLLEYGEPCGNRLLREVLADWASQRHGCVVTAEQVLVTRGSRMALTLISMALLQRGEAVGVENPGNRGAWDILRRCADVRLQPLSVDEAGLRVEALASLLQREPLRALYLTPRCQYPTSVSLDPSRARALLKLAAEHRLVVIEDDGDAAFHYGESNPQPLHAMDATGQVIHIGSLSRMLAPGVRLGYILAPSGLVDRLAKVRRDLEWQGDRVLEWAVADLIRDGELARHLRRVRRIYADRRDACFALLQRTFVGQLTLVAPRGGLSLWIRGPHLQGMATWVDGCRRFGLKLFPPGHYFLDGPEPCFRMGFAQLETSEMETVIQRMAQACPLER